MTIYSLADLGKFFKNKSKSKNKSKNKKVEQATYTCPHCKKELHHIEGINVYVCTNIVKKKDGSHKECGYRKIV